jgi:hypothetical protein
MRSKIANETSFRFAAGQKASALTRLRRAHMIDRSFGVFLAPN